MGKTERSMTDPASTAMTSVRPHPARPLSARARPARLDHVHTRSILVPLMLIGIALAALSLFGCGSNSSSGSTGESADANTGTESVAVELEANATTGYEWSYTMDPEDILYEDSSEYVTDKSDEGVTGAGGTQRYVFKAKKDGTVTVTFTYARRWEDVAPAQTATYTFTVKDGLITQDSVTTQGDMAGTDDSSSTNVA